MASHKVRIKPRTTGKIDNNNKNDSIIIENPQNAVDIDIKKDIISVLPEQYKNIKFHYAFHDNLHYFKDNEKTLVKRLSDNHPHRLKISLIELKSDHNLKTQLPTTYSLSQYVNKILNQGDIGACVCHSAVQALHIVMDKIESNRYYLSKLMFSSNKIWGSRLFLYDNARRIDGSPINEDSGTTNYTACLALEQYKICPEDLWPYLKSNLSVPAPQEAYIVANKYKNFKYVRVDCNITAFKSCISQGHPIMIGIMVFPSFIHSGLNGGLGDAPMPNENIEHPIGGHSLLVIGYDDDKQKLEFVNHWGLEWGNNGKGTLSYDFIFKGRYAGDFFAICEFS